MSFPPFDIYVNVKMIDVCKYFCLLLLNSLAVDATHSTCTLFIVEITFGSIVLCMLGCLNLLHDIFFVEKILFIFSITMPAIHSLSVLMLYFVLYYIILFFLVRLSARKRKNYLILLNSSCVQRNELLLTFFTSRISLRKLEHFLVIPHIVDIFSRPFDTKFKQKKK